MIFLDCPAYQDEEGAARCGLPAEVRRRFIMWSTDGPVESAVIRCPAGHWFNGPVESLTWERTDNHDPGTAAGAPNHLMEAVTVADNERYPGAAVPQPTASAAGRVP